MHHCKKNSIFFNLFFSIGPSEIMLILILAIAEFHFGQLKNLDVTSHEKIL